MFKEAADIKTSDQLHLPVPEAKLNCRGQTLGNPAGHGEIPERTCC